jgi:hypothetical protein
LRAKVIIPGGFEIQEARSLREAIKIAFVPKTNEKR